jgi:hypothetical protein
MKLSRAMAAPSERRKSVRTRVLLRGLVCEPSGTPSFTCAIRELTRTGARIALPAGRAVAAEICLINVREKVAHDAIMLWHNHIEAGFALLNTLALSPTGDPRSQRLYANCVGVAGGNVAPNVGRVI